MFVWVSLPEGWDTTALLGAALAHDVAFVPGAPFYPSDPPTHTMRLSFTTYDAEHILEGTRRLAAALSVAG
jgi:DNA-binding transcriptional MocR family regulator